MEGLKKRRIQEIPPREEVSWGQVVAYNVNLLFAHLCLYLSLADRARLSVMNRRTYESLGKLDASVAAMRKYHLCGTNTSRVAYIVENAPMECVKFLWNRLSPAGSYENWDCFMTVACEIGWKRLDVIQFVLAHYKSMYTRHTFGYCVIHVIRRLVQCGNHLSSFLALENKEDVLNVGPDFRISPAYRRLIWTDHVLHLSGQAWKVYGHLFPHHRYSTFKRRALYTCLDKGRLETFDRYWFRMSVKGRRFHGNILMGRMVMIPLEAQEHFRVRLEEAEEDATVNN
jgi:hypothetical protein